MNYSENEQMVRVDIWKASGKWYTTLAIEWLEYDGKSLIHDIFRESLIKSHGSNYKGMTATCLLPHHIYSHPLMLKEI